MKEISCKMKLRLREARNADAEYQARWTSIPREVFDKIIALDPKTDIILKTWHNFPPYRSSWIMLRILKVLR